MNEDVLIKIRALGTVRPVGSRTIPGAYKDTSDYDFILLSENNMAIPTLQQLGFTRDGEPGLAYPSSFKSFRNDDINVILTNDPKYFDKYYEANLLAIEMKLLDREQRVRLFKYVRDGVRPVRAFEDLVIGASYD